MKVLGNILKILAALAAIAGVIYVIVKYGDEIVAWTRKTVSKYCPCCCTKAVSAEEVQPAEEQVAEEDFAEEAE